MRIQSVALLPKVQQFISIPPVLVAAELCTIAFECLRLRFLLHYILGGAKKVPRYFFLRFVKRLISSPESGIIVAVLCGWQKMPHEGVEKE